MLLLLTALSIAEATEIPRHRLFWESFNAVRINPLGLVLRNTLSWRVRLIESDSKLFGDTFVAVGPTVDLTPAFTKGGLRVQVVPMAMLSFAATYRLQGSHGVFNQVQGFDRPTDDWSDTALDEGVALARLGHMVELEGRVQAAVGPIAARFTTRGIWNTFDLDEPLFYDSPADILAPNDGWILVTDTDLLWIGAPEPLRAGVRWSRTVPLVGDGGHHNVTDRIGPVVMWTFKDDDGARFDKPTLLLLSQWHLRHPFRTGQDVHVAIPYLAVAFMFQGDMIPF